MEKVLAFILLGLASLASCDNRIRYVFYEGEIHERTIYTVQNFHEILMHPRFIREKTTIMFHYSESQNLATPEVFEIVNSYIHTREFNFIMIDYENINTVSQGNANSLASGITTSMIGIFDRGYNSGFMSAIGFGLGAHIMARACRQVSSQSQRRHICGRLTGLDPIDLFLHNSVTIGRLTANDAQFVETVHTEGNSIGDHDSRGHVAFFVNGAMTQPFCTQSLPGNRAECSHIFAMRIWAEAARTRLDVRVFPSLLCDSWAEFNGGMCNNNDVSYIGRSTQFDRRGPYQTRTNWTPPYSRGTAFP